MNSGHVQYNRYMVTILDKDIWQTWGLK